MLTSQVINEIQFNATSGFIRAADGTFVNISHILGIRAWGLRGGHYTRPPQVVAEISGREETVLMYASSKEHADKLAGLLVELIAKETGAKVIEVERVLRAAGV